MKGKFGFTCLVKGVLLVHHKCSGLSSSGFRMFKRLDFVLHLSSERKKIIERGNQAYIKIQGISPLNGS